MKMSCGSQSSEFVRIGGRYEGSEKYEGYYMEGCISSSLPVLGTSGKANASDYEQLISDGFVLRWDPPPPAASGKLFFSQTYLWIEEHFHSPTSVSYFLVFKIGPSFSLLPVSLLWFEILK
jgi:hypothetical protein